ncbi:GNAT family N-acetyltransferase [Cupriavidus necator]|uniref:GNAT family N-acetyltransferase n=1 Tax=Cupriavidus necator TaxID=106590 RepID=A0A367P8R7_CUPNE|nr:GNAT family N-acetyltransferase [Cupriavidus necator]QQX87535.1 GNAT family N-acetyltransferase [Cupriavidus necator]RCJ04230.1 GNAT family N-acetyltransferase [Cupriavidus necator]
MSDLALIPATAADAERLAAMHAASWQHTYPGILPAAYLQEQAYPERLAAWRARMLDGADGPAEVTLAMVDGEAAGFACLLPDAEPQFGIYLDNLHVLPAFHGHGLGKRLLAHCAQRVAGHWPGRPLFLYVLEDNTQAREFYRRLGGEESDVFEDDFPGPGLRVMVRRVTWPDVAALVRRLTSGKPG